MEGAERATERQTGAKEVPGERKTDAHVRQIVHRKQFYRPVVPSLRARCWCVALLPHDTEVRFTDGTDVAGHAQKRHLERGRFRLCFVGSVVADPRITVISTKTCGQPALFREATQLREACAVLRGGI